MLLWITAATMHGQAASPSFATPSSGSGSAQLFTAVYSDPNSGSDMAEGIFNIMSNVVPGTTGWSAHECLLRYDIRRIAGAAPRQKANPAGQSSISVAVGRPPQNGFGNLYCKLGRESFSKNGGQPLRPRFSLTNDDWDYDVNILTPDEPETSPHWTSPRTRQTYATAWRIDFAPWLLEYGIPGTVYAYAVSDTCEIVLLSKKGAFFEGAAILYSDKQRTQRLGHVFVEQMGFN
jgi:hypothetical protein